MNCRLHICFSRGKVKSFNPNSTACNHNRARTAIGPKKDMKSLECGSNVYFCYNLDQDSSQNPVRVKLLLMS